MRFASFLSGEFTTMAVINPPERKLTKRTSVHCADSYADIDAHNMGNIHDENRMFARMHSGRYFFFVHLHNCQIIHHHSK